MNNARRRKKRNGPKSSRQSNQPPGNRRRQRGAAVGGIAKYAHMLSDPCNATLVPGFNGTDEGVLSRLKTSYSTGATNTNGYLLWCPVYVGGSTNVNCVLFVTSGASTPAVNTAAAPFGLSGGTSGVALNVGATEFVTSSTVSDFRLVSACIRATYTGALQDSQGILASIENLPVDTLLLGQATLDAAASVDNLFSLSSNVKRFGPDTHEIRYRNTGSESFKLDSFGVMSLGEAGVSRTTLTPEAQRFAPTMFGFAWKGLDTSKISFDFIQNIEWRPETRSGFVSVVPRQITPSGHAKTVMAWLDKNYPDWTTVAHKTATSGLLRMASSMFSGAALL